MKRMKKIFAMLLALTMVLGMTMTTSAAIAIPSDSDAAEVTVEGLTESTLTVTAYQIVDADYYDEEDAGDEQGFKGYVIDENVVTLLSPEAYNLEAPVSEHITKIANEIAKGAEGNLSELTDVPLQWDSVRSLYKADLTAGAWVILVDSADSTYPDDAKNTINIYNPMLAGVYYTNTSGSGNEITGGEAINATGNWALQGTEMYAKSTITKFDKSIVESSTGNENADDAAIGDTVTYQIDTYMPKYSKAYGDVEGTEYKELQFVITDRLSDGLTPCAASDVTVKADNTKITTGFTVDVTGQVITVDFTEDGIRTNGGKDIQITYTAVINGAARVDQNANTNDARLDFTNDPSGTIGFKKDVTYHHTFEFNVKKVNEKGEIIKDAQGNPLAAEFKLTRKDKVDGDKYVYVKESDENGIITFTGLDVGTYSLVETKAPIGYQIDTTEREVVISATYDGTTGEIESYTIKIADAIVESWTKGATTSTNQLLSIMNTKLIALPSTGGIGTTIFTVAGCGIMIAAAFFFFAGRKKEEN